MQRQYDEVRVTAHTLAEMPSEVTIGQVAANIGGRLVEERDLAEG